MCSQWNLFRNLKPYNAHISIANGDTIEAAGIGEIVINVKNTNGHESPITLREVLYVPGLGPNNLVSVCCIQLAGAAIHFAGSGRNEVNILANRDEITVARLLHNSYVLSAEIAPHEWGKTNAPTANQAQHSKHCGTLTQ